MIKVTIAIPCFNNEKTIRRAIISCLNQTDLDGVEILVINNASTDSTKDILLEFKSKIKIVSNEKTVSLFENHNVALEQSSGDYILFCHSDDTLYPSAISIIKKTIAEMDFPTNCIVWGHSHFRDFYPSIKNANFMTGQTFAGLYAISPFLSGGLTPSGTCYSKSFLKVGGFLPTQHRLAPSDSTSMINAALHGFKFRMVQDILFERLDASTLLTNTSKVDSISGYNNAFENLVKIIGLNRFQNVFDSSSGLNNFSYPFMSFSADIFPFAVLKRTVRNAIRNPVEIMRTRFYKVIIKSLKSMIK